MISTCWVLYFDFDLKTFNTEFVWICMNSHSSNCALSARGICGCELASDHVCVSIL